MVVGKGMGRLSAVLLWMLLVAALFGGRSGQREHDHYRSCNLGKGHAKLYNCDSKDYDSSPSSSGTVKIATMDTPSKFLVKLRPHESAKAVDEICEQAEAYRYKVYSGYCIQKYKKVWIGMLMMINGGNLSHMLIREAASIDHVEVDGTVRVCNGVVQGNPPNWGLDRIDHVTGQHLLNELYATASTGDGVHVYVLDTGIRCSHKEFHYQDGRLNTSTGLPLSRCSTGFDALKDGHGINDCNGHGTHCAVRSGDIDLETCSKRCHECEEKPLAYFTWTVSEMQLSRKWSDGRARHDWSDAGIVGGLTTGVAKDVILHPVRALDCDGSGTYGEVIASLDWISHNLIRPAVISMSLAAQASISIDQAVNNLINTTGVIGVAAAGNFLQVSCNYSPARASSVISVGSSNILNEMSWFSNYGGCTTLFAPTMAMPSRFSLQQISFPSSYVSIVLAVFEELHQGELVYSTYNTSDSSYAIMSGTSMACPHVAGTAALYLSQNVDARPSDVRQVLLDATESHGVAFLKPETTTKLLNTNFKLPLFHIHPRSFYSSSENSTERIAVLLTRKPSKPVILIPQLNAKIGHFVPAQLVFGTGSSWSLPQNMSLVLTHNPDFLDHSSTIDWVFQSQDTLFAASLDGIVTAHDIDICQDCGQTPDNPKIIPSLPFYYLEDTSKYQNFFNDKLNASCQGAGPDVFFQYTAPADMVVNISLCGFSTQFDTLLSLYEKINTSKSYHLAFLECNDDYCGLQSFLLNVVLQKDHTYIIVVDGYSSTAHGAVDFYMYNSGASSNPLKQVLPTAIPFITSSINSLPEVDSAICTRWVGAKCENPPPRFPILPEFFWSPVTWGLCDKTCGGGSQQAVMKCFTGNYTQVPLSYCEMIAEPQLSQACNLVACISYTRFEGPWGECNQTCGSGTQKRQVICMDSLGNTADPRHCGGESTFHKEQQCNTHACNGTRWEVGQWNYCNLPCPKGQKSRKPTCWSNDTAVGDHKCRGLQLPVQKQNCNTQPCQTYTWLLGSWNPCSSECDGIKSRIVQCVDGSGQNVSSILCQAAWKPAERIPCQQPNATCINCDDHNCSNNGICQMPGCNCFKGWEGVYCERPTECKGRPFGHLKNGSLGCCPFAKMDNQKKCCWTSNAKIDVNGACCDGLLDACGMCNGPHRSLDSQSQCCSTIRDEKGICCASGMLDECYVCDGDGTTCATNITITTSLDDSIYHSKNSSINWKSFIIEFMAKVASQLQVATEALVLTGVQTMNTIKGSCRNVSDVRQGCLKSVTTEFLGVFNFTVLPIPSSDLTSMKIEASDIGSHLSSAKVTRRQFLNGVKILSVSNAGRVGICGNGVCERGERCSQFGKSQTTAGLCCLKDCPYVPISCPIPLDGPRANVSCSANGICFDASGQCDCFPGYQGQTCQYCQPGWTDLPDGTCMKIFDVVRLKGLDLSAADINASSPAPTEAWNETITVTKEGAAAGIVGTIIIFGTCIGLGCCINYCCCNNRRRLDDPMPGNNPPRNIEMEEINRQAQEARRKSLAVERSEAVQDRRTSRMYDGGAVRKSLLMEPIRSPTSPPLSPVAMQPEQGNIISRMRRSIVGEGAVVIDGLRKSFSVEQPYAQLDPSHVQAEGSQYKNAPMPLTRYEDQQFHSVPLASPRYDTQQPRLYPTPYEPQKFQSVQPTTQISEGKQFQNPPPSLSRYEGPQYQNNSPRSRNAEMYPTRYEGHQYQNAPQSNQNAQQNQTGQRYDIQNQNAPKPNQNTSQLNQTGQRYDLQNQNAQMYTSQPEGQQYQNAFPPRYSTQQFQNAPIPFQRYESQQYQSTPARFEPSQHFQIIPIQNATGASQPLNTYPSSMSPTDPNAMAATPTATPTSQKSMGAPSLSSKPPSPRPPSPSAPSPIEDESLL